VRRVPTVLAERLHRASKRLPFEAEL
jgi:hypothetical protein